LLSLTTTKRDFITERRNELTDICIKSGINNPIIGESLYDPKAFDYSKCPLTFAQKINSLCFVDPLTYYKYKGNSRGVLDIKVGQTED
jgi:hypothetical protein